MVRKEMQIDITKEPEKHPIAKLVQEASRFSSSIFFEYKDKNVNAKSIMGMMSLGVDMGDTVTISAEGADEEAAVNSIAEYLAGGK